MKRLAMALCAFALLAACGNAGGARPSAMPDSSTQPNASGAEPIAIQAADVLPQTGDAAWTRVPVTVTSAVVRVAETFPVQVTLDLRATLPSGCHALRVNAPTEALNGAIALDVYSVLDPARTCAPGEQRVATIVPLNQYAGGAFTVTVNGAQVGEFTR
jgi:hypothetical protein